MPFDSKSPCRRFRSVDAHVVLTSTNGVTVVPGMSSARAGVLRPTRESRRYVTVHHKRGSCCDEVDGRRVGGDGERLFDRADLRSAFTVGVNTPSRMMLPRRRS